MPSRSQSLKATASIAESHWHQFTVTRHCEVSFPPKTSRICQAKRTLERQPIDKRWNLTKRPFDFMVLNNITRQCEVSLPQKTSLICQRKRVLERQTMKKIWKLTKSPFGFMVLDRTPTEHVFKTFVDPFSRFNMEHYLQTVLTSDLTHSVYNVLVKNVGEIQKDYNYKVLSKYFAMASKLGGEVALRPSQYEAFVNDKDEWISDKYFTQQRLAGVNPMSLMRVTNSWKGLEGNEEAPKGLDWKELEELLNPNFDWKAAVQTTLGTNDSLKEVIDQGRIYVLRYEFMDNLPREPDLTDHDNRREMWNTYSPIALFASTRNFITKRNHLVPVAIQMDFTQGSAVYTPEDGGNWMLAKLNLQITDLGYVQIVEHLAKTHLLMEPFCVILKRAMSSKHPLHQILKYHCRDLTIPNSVGTPALIDDGNYMDQLFAFGSNGTGRLLNDAHKIATWEVTDFRGELKRRGLDDKELLPYFPYRDDGEQILKAIENLVKEYVDLYYDADKDVKKDWELKDYLNQLWRYGKIKGLPASIDTKQELYDIVTRIISQLTIQHAAVNYPLSDYAQYIPNLPTKLYNDTRVEEGEFDVLRLPNRNTSSIEASFTNSLALYRFDTIFDYGNNLQETRAVKLLNQYFGHLMNVVQPEMQLKNQQRKEDGDLTYPYLIPRWLPNGIQT
ncbi:allene oxide synthase-lipoxygenase protein-like isoform X2 [Acropora palmata]|uniref:allene oxide synthase-lipoxygenase protein-like isoform X2 n=1 Tax=Acropora palmata TaxID=6131 RepID=UPI003DA15A07